ncbi:MAG: hypothetical protein ABIQ56_04480, partial [Chitinophagaceae bacterium]
MKINILSNKIPWFGRFSGYECLPDYLPKKLELKVYTSKFNLVNKILGKIYKMKNGWNFLRSEDVLAEVQFMHGIRNSSISHILYLETHIHILEKINDKDPRVIGTIHLPISQWKEKQLHLLSKMNNVIILYKEEMEEFA